MKVIRLITTLLLSLGASLLAQTAEEGLITGSVADADTDKPIEYVAVALKKGTGAESLRQGVTGKDGSFVLEKIPFGEYRLAYGLVGTDARETKSFTLDASHRTLDLGRLKLSDNTVKLAKVEVSTTKEAFYNSIDRKVYNVGKDIQSLTGSASDLLQNIPSVQVDVEGNVSLRGNESVLILIDGKPSALMGANRAAVLEQMPADAIDKIEVITNPSAKYKPDGTAGIINIALKKKHSLGVSSTARLSVGTDSRYVASVLGNFNPGKYNLYGSYSLKQDDRLRTNTDTRRHVDSATGSTTGTEQRTRERARPISHIAQTGFEYKPDEHNTVGASVNLNHRFFERRSTVATQVRDASGALTSDYDRNRFDPEIEQDIEYRALFQHSFADEGHELNLDLKFGDHKEREDNRYTNVNRIPSVPATLDNELIRTIDRNHELTLEYLRPLAGDAKLESGYVLEGDRVDMDFLGSFFNPLSKAWEVDNSRSNRFRYSESLNTLYATYGRPIGDFGFLAGARMERADIRTHQVTARIDGSNDYFRLYPSLHLSYRLTEASQLQANYSHRIRRPEGDDMNPFPEYQDPFNLRQGNPNLKPEETHSIETGWQYKKGESSLLSTVYYRQTYHGITEVSRYISPTVLLTTKENLSVSRSGGLELAATRNIAGRLILNASSNVYRNEIDATNLGYRGTRATYAWNAKLSSSFVVTKSDLVQLNANYTAKRLTPQGYRLPTFVSNIGYKHEFKDRKTEFFLTVSDLFNSLKDRTQLNTPVLQEDISRRRSPRIVYIGFAYHFGKPAKKNKDDMQFDNQF